MTTVSVERIDYLHEYQFAADELQRVQSQHLNSTGLSMQREDVDARFFQSMHDADDDDLVKRLNQQPGLITLAEILRILSQRHGLKMVIDFHGESISIANLCENFYEAACSNHYWTLVRRMADLLGKVDTRLEDTLLEIIIRQKRLAVGRAYSEEATFSKPTSTVKIISVMHEYGGKTPAESALSQEILLHLGLLLKSEPDLFQNILTLRLWHFIQLLVGKVGRDNNSSFGEAYETLLSTPPSGVLALLREVLGSLSHQVADFHQQEMLSASGIPAIKPIAKDKTLNIDTATQDWDEWRNKTGGLIRLTPQFYKDVWFLLTRCNGLVIGDKFSLGSRIGAEITHDSTPGEHGFALLIESELNNIESPAYRQLNIELLETLIDVLQENPQLKVEGDLTLDIIIGYAVRISWQDQHEGNYDEQREHAWHAFYSLDPNQCKQAFVESIWHLLTSEQTEKQAN
jgi:phosphorylase kinase alpha/beta subunit